MREGVGAALWRVWHVSQGHLGRWSWDRGGKVAQRARRLAGRGSGVSKDMEARVCVLENGK